MEFQSNLLKIMLHMKTWSFYELLAAAIQECLWRCSAGMLVEMVMFNKDFRAATGQKPTDQSNNASSSVQKGHVIGTIQDRKEYRTHLRLNRATIEANRMTE